MTLVQLQIIGVVPAWHHIGFVWYEGGSCHDVWRIEYGFTKPFVIPVFYQKPA